MRRVRLSRGDVTVSRLGLGTSRFHYLSAAGAGALVDAALDCGVTHFDTAPLYGDGFAESVIGARSERRSDMTIATKFGILPSRLIGRAGPLATPLRAARAILRRAKLVGRPRRSWSVETLDRSLARSLAALRTDHVDILFLHDPKADEITRPDELMRALERHRDAGRVRSVGVSGGAAVGERLRAEYPSVIDVVQTAESDWAPARLVPDITFGLLSGGVRRAGTAKPGADTAAVSVDRALARRPDGAVLVGTTRSGHLRDLAALAAAAP